MHPEHKKRKRIGHLYDGILQLNGHEVGVAEHARYFAGEKEKKWVADTLKVVKVLHDMLYHLQMHVHSDSPDGLGGLHVVGMVTAGKSSLPSHVGEPNSTRNRMAMPVPSHGLWKRLYMSPFH